MKQVIIVAYPIERAAGPSFITSVRQGPARAAKRTIAVRTTCQRLRPLVDSLAGQPPPQAGSKQAGEVDPGSGLFARHAERGQPLVWRTRGGLRGPRPTARKRPPEGTLANV